MSSRTILTLLAFAAAFLLLHHGPGEAWFDQTLTSVQTFTTTTTTGANLTASP